MKKLYPNTFIQSILLLLLGLLTTVPFVGIFEFYLLYIPKDIKDTLSFIILGLSVIIIAFIVNSRRKITLNYNLKLSKDVYPLIILVPIVILCFQIGVNIPFSKFFHIYSNKDLTNPFDTITNTVGALLLAPIIEETIFRGIMLNGILSKYKPITAIIFVTLFFAIIHVNPTQIFAGLVLGFIFGVVFYKTKNLGFCIMLHSFANLTGLGVGYLVFANHSLQKGYAIYGKSTIYIIGLFIFLLCFFSYRLYHKLNKTI